VEFQQIKEKFCRLVVMYSAKDDEAKQVMKDSVKQCVDSLTEKGLHPKEKDNEQGNK
jgi:hypothetical protein